MRFLFLTALLCLFLYIPIVPLADGGLTLSLVEAKGLVPCGGTGESPCNACHAMGMVNSLISYMFTIITFLAVMVIMYAGVKLVTSQGNASEWEEAKGMMTNMIVGFVIVLSAWLVVDTLMKMLIDTKVVPGMWNELDTSSCDAPLQFNAGDKTTGGAKPAGGGAQVQAGCPTCVAVTGVQCKNKASCTVSADYASKLNSLSSAFGEDLVVAEAYPPTRTHKASCHTNGTCTDIVFEDRKFTTTRITEFQNAAAKQGMRAVFEPGPGGSCSGISNCLDNSKTGATGDHFSLYLE